MRLGPKAVRFLRFRCACIGGFNHNVVRIVLCISCERYESPAVRNRVLHVLVAVLVGIYKLVCTVKGLERAACIVADCCKSFLCLLSFMRTKAVPPSLPGVTNTQSLFHSNIVLVCFVIDFLVGRRGVPRTVVVSVTVRVHARCFDFLMRTNDTFLFHKVFVRQLIRYIRFTRYLSGQYLPKSTASSLPKINCRPCSLCRQRSPLLAVCFKRIVTFINRER